MREGCWVGQHAPAVHATRHCLALVQAPTQCIHACAAAAAPAAAAPAVAAAATAAAVHQCRQQQHQPQRRQKQQQQRQQHSCPCCGRSPLDVAQHAGPCWVACVQDVAVLQRVVEVLHLLRHRMLVVVLAADCVANHLEHLHGAAPKAGGILGARASPSCPTPPVVGACCVAAPLPAPSNGC